MEELTENQKLKIWEKEHWLDFNEFCKSCIKKCKQSYKVSIECPNRIKVSTNE